MLNKIVRGAFLLLLAGMIVAWAFQAVKSEPVDQPNDPPIWIVFT
jgi:hypothetical protein